MYQISYSGIGRHISFVVRNNEASGSRLLVFHIEFTDVACTPVSLLACSEDVIGKMLPYCHPPLQHLCKTAVHFTCYYTYLWVNRSCFRRRRCCVMRQIDSFRASRKFTTTQMLEFCALCESDVRVKVTHEATWKSPLAACWCIHYHSVGGVNDSNVATLVMEVTKRACKCVLRWRIHNLWLRSL